GGGYEVGGVLFGRYRGEQVQILASRPLSIQPPRPSFVLSGNDENKLLELIEKAKRDPELATMEVVGWYHSQTRTEIFLSETEVEICDRHFPEPWQVALVLHPGMMEPVRAGFFFREEDGFVRTDQSYQEFALDAPVRPSNFRKQPPWELDDYGNPR